MLHKPGEPVEQVYFPGGGFCSIVTVLEDGRMIEVATVGREGKYEGSIQRPTVRSMKSRISRDTLVSAVPTDSSCDT